MKYVYDLTLNNYKKVLSVPHLSLVHMHCTKNTNKRREMQHGYTIKPSDVFCAACVQLQVIIVLPPKMFLEA